MEPQTEKYDLKEFAKDVALHLGEQTYTQDGRAAIYAGNWLVKKAFDILGWEELHPVPECECQYPGCTDWADASFPVEGESVILCAKHYREYKKLQELYFRLKDYPCSGDKMDKEH